MSAQDDKMVRLGRHVTDFALRLGWDETGPEGAFEFIQRKSYAQGLEDAAKAGWMEAVKAWSVCASIHVTFGKGRDALFTTRQADYARHLDTAIKKAQRE